MTTDVCEGHIVAPLVGVAGLGAEPLELLQALLEVRALLDELREPLLLALVLLLRKRVDLAERFPAPLEPFDPVGELLAVVALGRCRPCFLEPAARFRRLRLEPRAFDVDRGRALPRLGRSASRLDFFPAESPQLRGELTGARG